MYVRPLLAVTFCGAAVYLSIIGTLEADKVFTMASMIAAFYFGERAALKGPK